jgi:hypothetical protein
MVLGLYLDPWRRTITRTRNNRLGGCEGGTRKVRGSLGEQNSDLRELQDPLQRCKLHLTAPSPGPTHWSSVPSPLQRILSGQVPHTWPSFGPQDICSHPLLSKWVVFGLLSLLYIPKVILTLDSHQTRIPGTPKLQGHITSFTKGCPWSPS